MNVSNLTRFGEVRLLEAHLTLNSFRNMVYNLLQMFFRPSFCANCGDKIERADWGILTSRRFCGVCEAEFKGYDLIPRFIVGIGILTGIFGFGSYLNSGPRTADPQGLSQPVRLAGQTAPVTRIAAANLSPVQAGNIAANSGQPNGQNSLPVNKPATGSQASAQSPKQKPVTEEPVYFCRAATKKGTPCSRRVKGNVRCYQHIGMPPIGSEENLSIKQRKPS